MHSQLDQKQDSEYGGLPNGESTLQFSMLWWIVYRQIPLQVTGCMFFAQLRFSVELDEFKFIWRQLFLDKIAVILGICVNKLITFTALQGHH